MASNPLMKAIVGSTQSKYVAWTISITVLVLCVSILVMQTDVPIGKRLLGVLFMVLITVPGVVLSLIELTCLVTGGSWKTNWWCWLLAWIIAVIVIVWCVIIIATTFNSILTYTNATKNIKKTSIPATEEESNDFAETVLANTESLRNNLDEEMEEEVDPDLELDNVVENDLMMKDLGLEEELKETENVFNDSEVNSAEFVNPLEDLDGNIEEGFKNCSSKKSYDRSEGFKNYSSKKSHDHLEGFKKYSSKKSHDHLEGLKKYSSKKSHDHLEGLKNKKEYLKNRKLARRGRY